MNKEADKKLKETVCGVLCLVLLTVTRGEEERDCFAPWWGERKGTRVPHVWFHPAFSGVGLGGAAFFSFLSTVVNEGGEEAIVTVSLSEVEEEEGKVSIGASSSFALVGAGGFSSPPFPQLTEGGMLLNKDIISFLVLIW